MSELIPYAWILHSNCNEFIRTFIVVESFRILQISMHMGVEYLHQNHCVISPFHTCDSLSTGSAVQFNDGRIDLHKVTGGNLVSDLTEEAKRLPQVQQTLAQSIPWQLCASGFQRQVRLARHQPPNCAIMATSEPWHLRARLLSLCCLGGSQTRLSGILRRKKI